MKKRSNLWFLLAAGALCLPLSAATSPGAPLPLKLTGAKASSAAKGSLATKAIDGDHADQSRWVSEKSDAPSWIEVSFGEPQKLAGIHLYSGFGSGSALKTFVVQFWNGSHWVDIPSATFENNQSTALAIPFDDTLPVITDRLRLWITASPDNIARVKEIAVWPASVGNLPPLADSADKKGERLVANEPVPLIYLNQSGFNLGKPKRFTAPTLPDGTPFEVRPAKGGSAVFTGTIQGSIGDFTGFNPPDTREYVVAAGKEISVPFRIGLWWLERVSYQGAVDFMIDSRHYLGNVNVACPGSFGWRDDHHFGWELTTLVPQWISNPSAYERMPHQVKPVPPIDPKLWGKLAPCSQEAPDIVKLIHWGADVIVTQGLKHEMLKAQLAYFLYAWPTLKDYLPAQNYEVVRDYAFAVWADPASDRKYPYDESPENNLLALKTRVGSTKGCYPPGFSVQPNLLMYEVAKREKRPDAELYFKAAEAQTKWMIANLDWNDPQTTKGQRMSEFITMTGLCHFLHEYPDRAPAGLAAKINAWAEVMIRRSNNLWDFRKLDDADRWTPMGEKPQMWNEAGNVVGLPAALLAAEPFLTDPVSKTRLDQLVYSHLDNAFGRNPCGRHFSFAAPREIEGVEHGWMSRLPGGIGRLKDARFVIDGSPKDGHYPYHPEKGNLGWTEGWIQFNTPFNLTLAYLAFAESKITAQREGNDLLIRLEAPLNFDYAKKESGSVTITNENGDREKVTVTEDSVNSRTLTGRIALQPKATAVPGDGTLQYLSGTSIQAAYGFGYLGHQCTVRP